MTVSGAEQQLSRRLRTPATSPAHPARVTLVSMLDRLPTGVWRHWWVPYPVLLEVTPSPDASERRVPSATAPATAPAGRLRDALAEVGLDPDTVEHFAVAALTAGALRTGADLAQVTTSYPSDDSRPETGSPDLAARTESASHVLGLVGSLTRLTAQLEGAMIEVVGDLTVRNGRILLTRKGVTDPDELTPDQTRRWRARAKSVTRREIEALTGWGEGEVSDLVALAGAPASVQRPVVASMHAGVTPWRLARRFLRELGHEAHEDAAEVADRLFGTDPSTACADRLDPDGDLKDGPWEHRLFNRALDGEATRLASRDPEAAARSREQSREKRDVSAAVHDDGTGTVTVSGTASQVAAVADRLERGARAARSMGDPRTLAELRADIAMSLLMHSGLELPDPLPTDADEVLRTRWTEQMRAVLAALPRAVLNVIVPFDALVHSPQRPLFGRECTEPPWWTPAPGPPPPGASPPEPPPPDAPPPEPGPGGSPREPAPPGGTLRMRPEVLSMGMVTGAFARFLTPDAIRELALTPGTTLHRLLIDPADGRCVERSVASYAPDAAMRAQVHAADVTCRAPGCVQHAPYTQLDHVIAHGDVGPTSESNLQDLHTRHHQDKTHGGWEAVMAPNRDVTWTSLLGRIYRTRSHDYRQYSTLLSDAVSRVHDETDGALAEDQVRRDRARAEGRPAIGTDGRGERRVRVPLTREAALVDAVDRAVYRALTYRGPARPLRAGDDYSGTDTDLAFLGWDVMTLTHTQPHGRKGRGPDPATAEAERATQRTVAPQPSGEVDAPGGAQGRDCGGGPGVGGGRGTVGSAGCRHDPDQTPPPF